jgi:hypothetical protein
MTIIDMLKQMELKLEDLLNEIKYYKSDKKMTDILKDAER